MRHRKGGYKLNRTREHRKAMFENMVTALLEYGRIETTVTKAKAVRPVAEKIITMAKNKSLHFQKMAHSIIPKKEIIKKLFEQIAPAFADRPGGYTRIIRTHVRRGDAVEMAILELVNFESAPKPTAGETTDKAGKPGKKAAKKEKSAGEKKPKKAEKAGK